MVVILSAEGASASDETCPRTDDPIALGLRAELKRCALVERGRVGDIRSITVHDAQGSSAIDLLEPNAALVRMSAPRRELSPAGTNRWLQHAPDDNSIVADVGCDPGFENRASIEVEQTKEAVRVRFAVVENVREALTKKRIAETSARDVALQAAKDFGDEDPGVRRARLYLTRRDCRFDARARLVYRVGTMDAHGRRVTDVDATTSEIVATRWSDGKTTVSNEEDGR
jgi:hypothetical protein